MIKTIMCAFALGLFISSMAGAQEQGQRPRHRMGPPPEAISACEGKSEGTSCEFQSPHGKITGTCETLPHRDGFACKPKNPPRRMGEMRRGEEDRPTESDGE